MSDCSALGGALALKAKTLVCRKEISENKYHFLYIYLKTN